MINDDCAKLLFGFWSPPVPVSNCPVVWVCEFETPVAVNDKAIILDAPAAIGVDLVQTINEGKFWKDHSELFDIIPPKTPAVPLTKGTDVLKNVPDGLVIKITTSVLLALALIFSTIKIASLV